MDILALFYLLGFVCACVCVKVTHVSAREALTVVLGIYPELFQVFDDIIFGIITHLKMVNLRERNQVLFSN